VFFFFFFYQLTIAASASLFATFLLKRISVKGNLFSHLKMVSMTVTGLYLHKYFS